MRAGDDRLLTSPWLCWVTGRSQPWPINLYNHLFLGVIQRTVLIRSGLYCPVGVVPGRLAQLIYFTLGRLIAKASKDLMGKQT